MKAMVPWREGLLKRNFISSCDSDNTQYDRIQLVPRQIHVARYNTSIPSTICGPRVPKFRLKLIIGSIIVLIPIAALIGYYVGSAGPTRREPPDPLHAPPPSASRLHVFHRGAVCTDAPHCSYVGRDILKKNGTAVDAAIAAMFCNGLLNIQSMGIGGGFFMTVYLKEERRAYSVVAREAAPAKADENMFKSHPKRAARGPLAVAVPGEVRGMWAAHQRWGALPWATLIEPSLELCRNGFNMSKALHDGVATSPYIINDSNLRKQFYDESRKKIRTAGSLIKPSDAFCTTLARIAKHGGDDMYNGSLAEDLVEDLRKVGSIITAEDLSKYYAKISAPITVPLSGGDTLFTPALPSSGVLLGYILNIISGYNFTSSSIDGNQQTILTYHRIIEAFKYAYATRTKLGDSDFLDIDDLIRNITSSKFAANTRLKINDTTTSNNPDFYGASLYTVPDHGTAHISIIAPNGDAVSVTSSVNYYFGAGFTTPNTGIIVNNVMDDFSSPGFPNYFGLQPSPANFIAPYKRPLSSMSPSIIIDKDMNVKMVIGASGGTKITTAVALITIRKLWFQQTIKQAVDAPRFHHQLTPMEVAYEYGMPEDVVQGLKAKGHTMARYRDRGSIICALYKNSTAIYANADFRKGGDVVGI